jgi:hypothetical protein
MRTIGTIARLQIQRGSLKTGEKPTRRYDPGPLLAVPRLNITPDGALGGREGGEWIVDVHHRAHPLTKNEDGLHGISLGFTTHYDAMRAHFGDRIAVGCAGENIIATTDQQFTYEELAGGVAILAPDGTEHVRLRLLQVAHPCPAVYGLGTGQTGGAGGSRKHLQFLDNGMRGSTASVGDWHGGVGDSIAAL